MDHQWFLTSSLLIKLIFKIRFLKNDQMPENGSKRNQSQVYKFHLICFMIEPILPKCKRSKMEPRFIRHDQIRLNELTEWIRKIYIVVYSCFHNERSIKLRKTTCWPLIFWVQNILKESISKFQNKQAP